MGLIPFKVSVPITLFSLLNEILIDSQKKKRQRTNKRRK